jgi:putative ABC transport system permease protein
VRRHVKALDPTLPIAAVEPMGQFVTDSVAQPRFRTTLLGLFAATALVLSLVGLYGVVSYNVGQRTREVGLRMALGAQSRDVTRLILAQGLGLAGLGLAAGLAGAILVTRSLSGLLFGVRPVDPATYAVVAVLFLAAGLSACYVPARRAMRVDPVKALRSE